MFNFTLSVQELRSPHATHTLNVRWFTSIRDIKDMLHRITGQPTRNLDLFYGTNAQRLSNNMTLHDFGIEKEGYVLRLTINNATISSRPQSFVLTPSRDVDLSEDCENILSEVSTGLKQGAVPMRTDVLDCTGGVYFMRTTAGRKIAVFKPHDEEQGMPNNGKGYEGNGETSLRPNFKPGQGCIREVAAYIMDVNDFTGVPPTTLVHCEHNAFAYPSHSGKASQPFPKLGSLQHFVTSDGTFEDVGSSLISDFEIQKIALFDMRLLNCDRNASNILVSKKRRKFESPLSHGTSNEKHNRRNSRSASVSSWESNWTQYSSSDDWMEECRSDDDKEQSFPDSGLTTRSNSDPSPSASPPVNVVVQESEGLMNLNEISSEYSGSSVPTSATVSCTASAIASATPSLTSSPRREIPIEKEKEKAGKSDKDRYTLIPIDHGYSLPTKLDIKEWDWVWFHLPHVKRPVHPAIRSYVLGLNFEDLVQKLTSQVAISEDSLFLLRISHNLLVNGIKAGLSLHQIASLIARLDDDGDVPSPVERAIAMAEENAHRAIEMRSSRVSHGKGMRVLSRAPPSSPLHSGNTNQFITKANSNNIAQPSNLCAEGNAAGEDVAHAVLTDVVDVDASFEHETRGVVDFKTLAPSGNGKRAGRGDQLDSSTASTRTTSTDVSANFAIGLMDVDVADPTAYESGGLEGLGLVRVGDEVIRTALVASDSQEWSQVCNTSDEDFSPKSDMYDSTYPSTESSPRALVSLHRECVRNDTANLNTNNPKSMQSRREELDLSKEASGAYLQSTLGGALGGLNASTSRTRESGSLSNGSAPHGAAYGMVVMDAPRGALMRLHSMGDSADPNELPTPTYGNGKNQLGRGFDVPSINVDASRGSPSHSGGNYGYNSMHSYPATPSSTGTVSAHSTPRNIFTGTSNATATAISIGTPGGVLTRQTTMHGLGPPINLNIHTSPTNLDVPPPLQSPTNSKKSPNSLYRVGDDSPSRGKADLGSIKTQSSSGDNLQYAGCVNVDSYLGRSSQSPESAGRVQSLTMGIGDPLLRAARATDNGNSRSNGAQLPKPAPLLDQESDWFNESLSPAADRTPTPRTPPPLAPASWLDPSSGLLPAAYKQVRATSSAGKPTYSSNISNHGSAIKIGPKNSGVDARVGKADGVGDVETDSEGVSPDEDDATATAHQSLKEVQISLPKKNPTIIPDVRLSPEQVADQDMSMPVSGAPLMRVTSFTAFGNPPLYDVEAAERRFGKLTREKRRQNVSTLEFRTLRQHFTQDRLLTIISQLASLAFG